MLFAEHSRPRRVTGTRDETMRMRTDKCCTKSLVLRRNDAFDVSIDGILGFFMNEDKKRVEKEEGRKTPSGGTSQTWK